MIQMARRCGFALLVVVWGLTGCERQTRQTTPTPAANAPSILLITLDTTRADRIGCYGYAEAQTPTLDRLAASGVRFRQAFCPVPLTLPSHASLLTGTYPGVHGAIVNGVAMQAGGVSTLAEVFQARGYRTGGFVSAIVLDADFGLSRGFDVYDDDRGGWDAVERRGDQVCDRALEWLAESPERPFFAWVHFFDPHDPYEPPEAYQELADPYDGEIAFADAQVARLLGWLEMAGWRDRTLVVVAGDHGEAFREHGERQHGLFLYDPTLHVPLIFSYPRSLPQGRVIEEPVGLIDVFPTILELLDGSTRKVVNGTPLSALWQGKERPALPVYGETEYPRTAFAWAPLRSLTSSRWKYIEAPRPELYDRAQDPGELHNVISENPDVAARMREQLAALAEKMIPQSADGAGPDPEMVERLQTLGYVAGGRRTSGAGDSGTLPDPKDRVEAYAQYSRASELLAKKRYADVVSIMEPLVRQSPESDQFHVTLGQAYLELGRNREAQAAFEASLEIVPDSAPQLWRLGEALRRQGQLGEAISQLQTCLIFQPTFAPAHCSLGDVYEEQGRFDEAFRHFRQAVTSAPNLGRAHGRLGVAYARQGKFPEARAALERYVELEPESPHARLNLGNVLVEEGEVATAIEHFRRALELDPRYRDAHRSLIQALVVAGRSADVPAALRAAHRAVPDDRELTARFAWLLATSAREDVRDPVEALRLARTLGGPGALSAHELSVLAAAEAASGNFSGAIEVARRAIALAETRGDATTATQIRSHLRRYQSGQPIRQ